MTALVWDFAPDPPLKQRGRWMDPSPAMSPGPYWWRPRAPRAGKPGLYWIEPERGRLRALAAWWGDDGWVDEIGGQWFGPLAPPD